MKKSIRRIVVCFLLVSIFWGYGLILDRQTLSENLIRFHVVANSDSDEDQWIKRQIRDVVINTIEPGLKQIADINEARKYVHDSIPKLQLLVDQTLERIGHGEKSLVSFSKESFPVRHYDTFSLPAGVYDSLRIVIGDGLGKNWWCVSFPTLCIPATTSGFSDTAVSAGFSNSLTNALCGNDNYEIRFYFLNELGKIQNIFFRY